MIVALRVYVAVVAVGLLVPAAILPLVDPRLACSDGPCRGTAEMLANAVPALLVAAAALVAAIGVQARGVRWLAAVCLSIAVLRYGYVMHAVARDSTAEALLMIVTTLPFMVGPLCVALWLCLRVSSARGLTAGR
jgi:hypothetical protein